MLIVFREFQKTTIRSAHFVSSREKVVMDKDSMFGKSFLLVLENDPSDAQLSR
jgi:hypothetical protein